MEMVHVYVMMDMLEHLVNYVLRVTDLEPTALKVGHELCV